MLQFPRPAFASVVDGSPADLAGLKRYDIITRVNGSDQADVVNVLDAIRNAKSTDDFTLTVLRGGQPVTVTCLHVEPAASPAF